MSDWIYTTVFLTTSSVTPPMYNNNRIFFLRCATFPHRGRLLFMLYFFKNIVLYSSGKAFVCTNIAVGDGAFDIPRKTISFVQIKTGGYGIRPYGKICRNRERSTNQYSKFFAKLSAKESGVLNHKKWEIILVRCYARGVFYD